MCSMRGWQAGWGKGGAGGGPQQERRRGGGGHAGPCWGSGEEKKKTPAKVCPQPISAYLAVGQWLCASLTGGLLRQGVWPDG